MKATLAEKETPSSLAAAWLIMKKENPGLASPLLVMKKETLTLLLLSSS